MLSPSSKLPSGLQTSQEAHTQSDLSQIHLKVTGVGGRCLLMLAQPPAGMKLPPLGVNSGEANMTGEEESEDIGVCIKREEFS